MNAVSCRFFKRMTMSVVGLELEEEIGHMADEQIANAKIFFTLSLSRMFYCFV